MSKSTENIIVQQATRIAALEEENEALSQQVKRLIKAEGELYEFQEQLDAQLKEYAGLYELNRTLNAVSDLPKIFADDDLNGLLNAAVDLQKVFSHAVAYVIDNLGYERVLFFRQVDTSGSYTVCASGGYYEQEENDSVTALVIPRDAPLLTGLTDGPGYLVCSEQCCQASLSGFCPRLRMSEYLLYPLGSRVQPIFLLVVGNSEKNARFYRRVNDCEATLLGIGNFAELLFSSLENRFYYAKMRTALERESLAKKKYHGIFENSVEGIFQTSPEGRILDCNPATANLLGYDSPAEIIREVNDIGHQLYVHPQRRDELFAMLKLGQDVKNFEVEFYCKDRSKIWALLSIRPNFNEENELLYIDGVLRDITGQRRLEEQLRQSQKMEVVGTLSGGLAHDFNNVLCGILGTASLLRIQLAKGTEFSKEKLCDKMDTVIELSNRAADVVAQLMIISRKQEVSLAPVDLRSVIGHVVRICRNTFDKSIELAVDIADDQLMINADSGQIEQVLLNLCINASHAMTIMREEGDSHRRELSITTARQFADHHFCIYHPAVVKGTEYWVLSVRDTGIGMDAKTVSRVFDPFFTTKEKGIGTGLGLSMAYNIVQQHKGLIDVYSEPGMGTTFNVYLPVLADDESFADVGYTADMPTGEGLLLVADDEPLVRQAAKSILEELGFDVLLAEDGEAAVSLYKEHSDEIKAIVMDMIMPKKSGMEAFLEIQRIRPDVKIIFSSGFMQDKRITKLTEMGIGDFIKKPYSMHMLAAAIARLLT